MRILSIAGGGVAGLSVLLATLPAATSANQTPRVSPNVWQRGAAQRAELTERRTSRLQPAVAVAPSPCPSDYSGVNGTGYFVGITNGNDFAGASFSVVGGGYNNDACGTYSGIGSGAANETSVEGFYGFIGGGSANFDDSPYSVIGGGYGNSAGGGGQSFIGSGNANAVLANAHGAFIGAGGSFGDGNEVDAGDAFVGAGDGNVAAGNGSFVGGGGSLPPSPTDLRQSRDRRVHLQRSHLVVRADQASGNGNSANGQDSFLGAGDDNIVSGAEAFLGSGMYNSATGDESALGGGYANSSGALESFVGGGEVNTIASAASYATIVGGVANSASGTFSAVLGGGKNAASNEYSSILGGEGNTSSGAYGVVVGGTGNTAAGELSFAGGYHAYAANNGSFVWSDYKSQSAVVKDTAANQFVARASGGVTFYSNEAATAGVSLTAGSGTWASLSDRNLKTAIVPLDDNSVLAKVSTLPVSTWSYKSEAGVRHVGPMAQDFYAAFGVGPDSRHITSIDEDGVALAAIKALHRENELLRAATFRSQTRAERVERATEDRLATLESSNAALKASNAALERRVDFLAAHIRV